MKQTARGTALDALLRMEEDEGYSNIVIDRALKSAGLDRRDGALASTLFYGVLEKRLTLDYFIEKCLSDPSRKLDRTARAALRCGAYQILYMDRVPDSAAVNETVSLIKERGKGSLAGFVNGVLRSLIRQKDALRLPEGNSASALSARYSVPGALIRLWKSAYGETFTLRLLESLGGRAATYIRVNASRTTPEALKARLGERGVTLTPLSFPAGCAILSGGGSPAALPEFREGLFHVQDLSAQLACEILDPQPGESVCDCCAAPGGKTFTLAESVGETGRVFAFDVHEGRVGLVEQGAGRLGLSNVTARGLDMTAPPEELPQGDKVLCDAPCSGFGVIRRKPEIRYKKLSESEKLPVLQEAILRNAARMVKPGGTVLYCTCTLNPAENGGVARNFLEENDGFAPMEINLPGIERTVDEPPWQLTITPFGGGSDGFFAALFRKR